MIVFAYSNLEDSPTFQLASWARRKTVQHAGLVESEDTSDLKSDDLESYQFKSGIPHHMRMWWNGIHE